MTRFLAYMRGYVEVRIWGYSPERFLNLCSNKGILLWDIVNRGNAYTLCMYLKDFYRLKPIVHKTGTRVSITARHGLPFFVPLMRARVVFGIGLFCCLAFLLFMSRYVWAFTFTGNLSITDEMLLDFLAENGVTYGTRTAEVDIEGLEKKIREQYQEVTWASLELAGTRLFVKLKENDLMQYEAAGGQRDSGTGTAGSEGISGNSEETDSLEAAEQKELEANGSNLTADCDGVVVSIITRQGVPQVKAGDEVKKSDVLVSGAVPIYGEDTLVRSYQYCRADADIVLQYEYTYQDTLLLEHETQNYTGREQNRYFLQAFGKEYSLSPFPCRYPYYDQLILKKQLHVFDRLYLPFWAGKKVNREYLRVETVYSEKQAKELLVGKLQKILQTLEEKGVQIIEKDVKIEKNRKRMTLRGSLTVNAPAGVEVPLTHIPIEGEAAAD